MTCAHGNRLSGQAELQVRTAAPVAMASTVSETRFQEACDTFERNFILRALEKSDWNVTATARYA